MNGNDSPDLLLGNWLWSDPLIKNEQSQNLWSHVTLQLANGTNIFRGNLTSANAAALISQQGTNVVIPEVSLDWSVCFANKEITSIKLPKTLTSIGPSAFRNTKITEVVIPDGVEILAGCF